MLTGTVSVIWSFEEVIFWEDWFPRYPIHSCSNWISNCIWFHSWSLVHFDHCIVSPFNISESSCKCIIAGKHFYGCSSLNYTFKNCFFDLQELTQAGWAPNCGNNPPNVGHLLIAYSSLAISMAPMMGTSKKV